jgi:outer membrane immunogenic protein
MCGCGSVIDPAIQGKVEGTAMKHVISIAASLLAFGAAPALAADIPVKVRPVAPVVAAPAYNWSGCYVGGYIGGAWGRDVNVLEGRLQPAGVFSYNVATNPYSYRLGSSFIGGGTGGCNYQVNALVVGFEAEVGYLRLRGSVADPNSQIAAFDTQDSTRVGDWYGLATARVGVAWDRALLYVKGGAAFIRASSSVIDTCTTGGCGVLSVNATGSSRNATWALGGGIEYAVSQNWSIKGEYMCLGLRHTYGTCGLAGGAAAAGSTYCWTHSVDGVHTAKVGLNYKFDWGAPLVARY